MSRVFQLGKYGYWAENPSTNNKIKINDLHKNVSSIETKLLIIQCIPLFSIFIYSFLYAMFSYVHLNKFCPIFILNRRFFACFVN